MDPLLTRHWSLRLLRRAQHALAREHGFTIVETLFAAVILIIVATSLAGVLTSSIAANTVSHDRTVAEQCASDQIEKIRRIPNYADVGTNPGNPQGIVSPTASCGNDLAATASITIKLVDDPTPTSYGLSNYKRVTVVVTRTRDSKELARVVTSISPDGRPSCPSCGATINVTVVDLGLQQPYAGAVVNMANGPSANRSDTTDSAGLVSFGALDPNPTSGATAYYDLTVTGVPGYQTLAADVPSGSATPPATPAHIQLAPGQTTPTSIRIFKPATINLVLLDAGGSPYTGGAALKITSSFTGNTTSDSVASGASGKTITSIAGDPVIPGATYTIKGYTTSGLCASPAASPVPSSGYPANTSETFTLQFTPCPTGTLAVNVQQLSANAPGATVDVTGGPNNISVSGTTDASGNVSFTVPEGAGYTITATKGTESASTNASVTAGSTTNATVTLPPPPMGSILVTANWDSVLASCTNCVTLTGGPSSISVTGSTNASGQVTFSNVPVGSGYTITVAKSGVSATGTATVTANTTTPVTVNLPTGTMNLTVKYGGVLNASSAAVTITGGPNSVSASGTTNASGFFTDPLPAGNATTYTVTATKAGQSVSTTFTLPTNGSVANVTLNLPVGTMNATVRWGAAGPFSNGAAITVTGGPLGGTVDTGTTNASGFYSDSALPAGTGTYTVSVTKGTASTSTTFTLPSSGSVANVTLTLPVRSSVVFTVKNNVGTNVGAGASVTMTGGPEGLTYSGTTNASSQVTFTNVPASTNTYVAKAWNCASAAGKSRTNAALTITSGATAQAVTLQYNSNTCPP